MKQEPVLTVWADGTWKVWGAMDAHYAKDDEGYLAAISLKEIEQERMGSIKTACPWCAALFAASDLAGNCPHCGRAWSLRISIVRHHPELDPADIAHRLEASSTRRLAAELGVSHMTVARVARKANEG